jgi:PAS domain S-box-containing protein
VAELSDRPFDAALARRLESLGDTSGIAVALGDAAGCIEWVNEAFQRLTLYTAAEMIGKRLDLLRGLDIGDPALDYVLTRFRSGESSRLEIPTRREPGRGERWLDIEVRPLGRDEGFVVLVSDVTGSKLAQRDPEGRAPASGRLERPEAPTPPAPSPVPTLSLQPVDVSLLVMESCDLLEAAVSGRTLLDLDLDGNLPWVQADFVRLREVLVSLVRHAADALAGAPGAICVRTSLGLDGSGHAAVELDVRDTGSRAERAHLARAVGSGSWRIRGLAEIRNLVEAHGGRLALTTQPGEGSRALVVLPAMEGR